MSEFKETAAGMLFALAAFAGILIIFASIVIGGMWVMQRLGL